MSRTTHVALLRGVNVGGNKKLEMGALRALCESLGYEDVRTVLQSGNVVFRASRPRASDLEKALSASLVNAAVFLRTPAELQRVIDANPFPQEAESDPGHLIVLFLGGPLPPKGVAVLESTRTPFEKFEVGKNEAYLYFGKGMGESKLSAALTEKKLGVNCTARNWNTVRKLAAG